MDFSSGDADGDGYRGYGVDRQRNKRTSLVL